MYIEIKLKDQRTSPYPLSFDHDRADYTTGGVRYYAGEKLLAIFREEDVETFTVWPSKSAADEDKNKRGLGNIVRF